MPNTIFCLDVILQNTIHFPFTRNGTNQNTAFMKVRVGRFLLINYFSLPTCHIVNSCTELQFRDEDYEAERRCELPKTLQIPMDGVTGDFASQC